MDNTSYIWVMAEKGSQMTETKDEKPEQEAPKEKPKNPYFGRKCFRTGR